jgi:hypothetical protein
MKGAAQQTKVKASSKTVTASPKGFLKKSPSTYSISSGINAGGDNLEDSPEKSSVTGDVTGKNSNKMMNKAELNRIIDT